jgi:hypothetical protein
MNIINSSWLEGEEPVGSVGGMGRKGPSTALRSSFAFKKPRRTGCSRRAPRVGRTLCRRKRSFSKAGDCARPRYAKPRAARDRVFGYYDGHYGGEARLPRFVPLWPALPHRVFFFGGNGKAVKRCGRARIGVVFDLGCGEGLELVGGLEGIARVKFRIDREECFCHLYAKDLWRLESRLMPKTKIT